MAKGRNGGNGFLALILLIVLFAGAFALYGWYMSAMESVPAEAQAELSSGVPVLETYFIDVGQADCALLIYEDESMLIDAGEADTAESVIEYIKSLGVTELTYAVATHPHSDHMGGMAKIIDAFPIKTFIAPDATNTSRTFENMLDALERNGVEITVPTPGEVYPLGGANLTVLSPDPDKTYDNLNNYSIVMKAVYGDTSLLFTGDAEHDIEKELLAGSFDLKSDVLKVGHHGSGTSSTAKFLAAVSPRHAIISVAAENSYGHPHEKVLERIEGTGAEIWQTSVDGTIIAESNGKTIEIRGLNGS